MNRDVKMDGQLDVPQEGYAGRMEVLAGPTGRRRRSDAEKARIAVESLAPGAVVADIARRYGATRWQVYDWRRRLRCGFLLAPQEDSASPAFVPLAVADDRKGTPDGDIVEVVVGDILIRVGREVSEPHLAHSAQQILFSHEKRRAFRPPGRDVGEDERLDETGDLQKPLGKSVLS